MKKIINLVSFDLRAYKFNVEQLSKETDADIRHIGIPCHDNEATMYQFFQSAYPSRFRDVESTGVGKYLVSDAPEAKNCYVGASQLTYRDACYITKETQQVFPKIESWLEAYALTVIDLPGMAAKETEKIKNIIAQMTARYNCIVVSYVPCFEKEQQTDTTETIDLKVPHLCWKGIRNEKAKTLLEQMQYDEQAYQDHIVGLMNKR